MAKILAIDDDPTIIELYNELLRAGGYTVDTADDPVTAVTKFRTFDPNLIICDWDMPSGGGKTFFQSLRAVMSKGVPVIFITGREADDLGSTLKFSKVAYIKKPFNREILFGKIDEFLGTAKAAAVEPEIMTLPTVDFKGMRVLVIDHIPEEADFIQRTLIDEGCETVASPDAPAGATTLGLYKPRVVFCNWDLPAKTARTFIETLRNTMHDSTPVIFISEKEKAAMPEAFLVKNTGYLKRPFTKQEALSALTKILSEKILADATPASKPQTQDTGADAWATNQINIEIPAKPAEAPKPAPQAPAAGSTPTPAPRVQPAPAQMPPQAAAAPQQSQPTLAPQAQPAQQAKAPVPQQPAMPAKAPVQALPKPQPQMQKVQPPQQPPRPAAPMPVQRPAGLPPQAAPRPAMPNVAQPQQRPLPTRPQPGQPLRPVPPNPAQKLTPAAPGMVQRPAIPQRPAAAPQQAQMRPAVPAQTVMRQTIAPQTSMQRPPAAARPGVPPLTAQRPAGPIPPQPGLQRPAIQQRPAPIPPPLAGAPQQAQPVRLPQQPLPVNNPLVTGHRPPLATTPRRATPKRQPAPASQQAAAPGQAQAPAAGNPAPQKGAVEKLFGGLFGKKK